ncbi:MAG: coproporphyrinogen III oxidase [Gemmataceae bacterium]
MSTAQLDQEKTGLGNYFIANYPPFSFWRREYVPQALATLAVPPRNHVPLGLYVHIPFCRRRCKFCYYRVYTDKNARDVERYLEAVVREVHRYAEAPAVRGRLPEVVYFGGGTPSYLSVGQLRRLIGALQAAFPWTQVREVTFECEPGTLQEAKVHVLKELGITRLSLGVENFDDHILEVNGRAHHAAEIARAWQWIVRAGFEQTNIDLIAGMLDETWDNWRRCIERTVDMAPDSVTIYQMELPYNTIFSQEWQATGPAGLPGIADWPTKRAWVDYAFDRLLAAGYQVSSAYTLVRDVRRTQFVYRDALWHGADLIGAGVASFGHLQGIHMQNLDQWQDYLQAVESGQWPVYRALAVTPEEQLIREFILQLKTGCVRRAYFRDKFGTDVVGRYATELAALAEAGLLVVTESDIALTRRGLLQVDRLLPQFFLPHHRGARYT